MNDPNDVMQVRPAFTPEEMRAEIFRMAHYNQWVRNITTSCNVAGLSSEDRYTMMAYFFIKQCAELEAQLLHELRISPLPHWVLDANGKWKS